MYIIHLILHNFSLVAQLIGTLSDPDLHVIYAHLLAYGIKKKTTTLWLGTSVPLFDLHVKP